MRRYALLLCVIVCSAGPAFADELTVHGFVTAVHSPDSFEIDDYKITSKPGLEFKVQRDRYSPSAPATLNHQDVRVGTELEVHGDYRKSSHELKADSVKVLFFDTVDVDRIARMENPVRLEKTTSGAWRGAFVVDGQRVVVSEATTVSIAQSLSDLDAERPQKANAASTKTPVKGPVLLNSLDALRLDSFVHYEGTISAGDGSIAATKVEFEDGGIEPGIIKDMKATAPKIKEPNYAAGKPGQLEITPAGPGVLKMERLYELLPNREAQEYISRLGNSLVPEHQKNLPEGDPSKIPFRFYLVSDKKPDANGYPSGVVVVNSGLLAALDNEAELAFLLSEEIAAIVEESQWRNENYHRGADEILNAGNGAFGALTPAGAIAFSLLSDQYWRALCNQLERVAIDLTFASGYDVREVPLAWRAVGARRKDLAFRSIYELRLSYLQSYVENQYSRVDYSALRRDSNDFHSIARQVAQAHH